MSQLVTLTKNMQWLMFLFMLVSLLVGCRTIASTYEELKGVKVPNSISVSDVSGTYSIPRGRHGSTRLHLRSDSTLTYGASDLFSGYDASGEGTWFTMDSSTVQLDLPTFWEEEENRGVYGMRVDVVIIDGTMALVPVSYRQYFLRYPSLYRVFRRVD